jgi:hypothetical protein
MEIHSPLNLVAVCFIQTVSTSFTVASGRPFCGAFFGSMVALRLCWQAVSGCAVLQGPTTYTGHFISAANLRKQRPTAIPRFTLHANLRQWAADNELYVDDKSSLILRGKQGRHVRELQCSCRQHQMGVPSVTHWTLFRRGGGRWHILDRRCDTPQSQSGYLEDLLALPGFELGFLDHPACDLILLRPAEPGVWRQLRSRSSGYWFSVMDVTMPYKGPVLPGWYSYRLQASLYRLSKRRLLRSAKAFVCVGVAVT